MERIESSFEDLVKNLSGTLKKITHKLNGRFTFFNDEDLFQEALLRLWLDFKEGKLDDKTDSYILQGCFFHLKNYIRKVKDKICVVSIDALVEEEKSGLEEIISLKAYNYRFEKSGGFDLSQEISGLGLTQREKDIISFSDKGFTVRQIGEKLGISHVMVVKLRKGIQEKCAKLKQDLSCSYQNN